MIYLDKNNNDDNVLCDACLDDYFDEKNKDDLVMCDSCNVAVHQSCYGHGLLRAFPEGEWFCERCQHLK